MLRSDHILRFSNQPYESEHGSKHLSERLFFSDAETARCQLPTMTTCDEPVIELLI